MKTVVGVLRGGPSSEYEVSLKTGAAVLDALDRERYEPRDIFIDRGGQWHTFGTPATPSKALQSVHVAINALHGEYGEDGSVQRLLDTLGVPYTGSGALPSALAFNKYRTRTAVEPLGIKLAHARLISPMSPEELSQLSLELFRTFPMPAIVKPVIGGSSVGTTIVRDFGAFEGALHKAFSVAPKALVEEYIRGREATVGVVGDFREQSAYPLLPVEIIPPSSCSFFDYEAKYGGESQEVCPGNFSSAEKTALMDAARQVHEALELSHYSRSDFIVSKRGIYFLEVNTLPGLTTESLLPKALKAVGTSLSDFLHHIIELATGRK